jgi:hypothetical protein
MRSHEYKEKLTVFAMSFTEHKKELHLLLSSKSAIILTDVKMNVKQLVSLLEARSVKEDKLERLLMENGGYGAVVDVRRTPLPLSGESS